MSMRRPSTTRARPPCSGPWPCGSRTAGCARAAFSPARSSTRSGPRSCARSRRCWPPYTAAEHRLDRRIDAPLHADIAKRRPAGLGSRPKTTRGVTWMANVADPAGRGTPEAQLNADGLERGVGFLGLLWASEGSIIGSGWLFGALTAASIAGPSAIIAWIVASLIVILLALVHAELGGLFPVSGGTSRFPHYAFGSLAGGTFGWFSYLQAASVAPIEVLAAVQYLSSFSWASSWYSSSGTLSGVGIVVAIAMMFFFVTVNLIGIGWLAK